MQVTQTSADGLKREFKVVISAKDLDEKLDMRLRELGRRVRVPGFRPGKVPPAVLKKRFGPSLMGEILEQSVADSAQQAMEERGMRPALEPKIEIASYEEGADLEYTMAVEVLPEIEPMDLSKIRLERLAVPVDDERVRETLATLAERHKRSQPVAKPRKSRKGDVLVIDFTGTVDGKPFPGGSAQDHHLELGSSTFISGFEDQLIGVRPGDDVGVTVTFPEAYGNPELAGKEAVFQVHIKEIREPVPMPIDDELAKATGFDSLAALEADIRQRMEREYRSLARARLKRALLDILAESHSFEVPQGMVDAEFEGIWKQIDEQRKQNRLDEEDAAKSEEQLRAEYREIAERRVRLGLLLSEIGRRNNIQVSKDEVTRAVMAEAQRFPGREREVYDFYQKNPEAMAELRAPLFEEKVIDFILALAQVSEREATIEELLAEPDEAGAKKAESAKTKVKEKTKKPRRAPKASRSEAT